MGSDQDSKLGFVVNAVMTMALALHDMYTDLCPKGQGLCEKMTPINGTLFLEYLLNVSFPSYSGHEVHFDDHGDPPGRYEILNYQPVKQADGNVTYKYVTIGQWMTGDLELNDSAIYWPGKGRNPRKPFQSVCSQPCGAGFVKQGVGSDGIQCCWVCTPCKDNEIVVDEAHCKACRLGWWPNDNKTDCEEIPVDFVTWHDTGSIVVATLACVGLLFTLWVTTIFVRSHNTPVVKASTRELSYILLIGISLAFSCNFILVSKPNPVLCYLSRIVPGLAFSLMYGALVTRTNRIARILEGSKRIMTKKPRFMSATAQVVITGIIIGIECVILSVMLVIEPADSKMDYSVPKRVRLVCNTSTLGIIVPLGFDLFLIFMCTLYAVKTRNLPENFNEAKFIGFTMYTTCVIWLGFFPIYFGSQNKEVTMSISISLSAAIALTLLFFPKVYIIVWAPEKNTRGAFTTSKDVRCHIGSKSMQSCDSVEFKEGRYDAINKSDSKMQRAWRQKSLDEKKLRFVMKRSSIPTQLSSSTYVNHGVLANHKTPAAGSSGVQTPPRAESKGFDSKRKSPMLKGQQGRNYIDDFSDYDCLLEEEEREASSSGGTKSSVSRGSMYRDSECQTGEELVQAMFLQLRRRKFHSSSSSNTPSSPYLPIRDFEGVVKEVTFDTNVVKEVTFDTHVVPVHVDSSWSQQQQSPPLNEHAPKVPEELPLLSRNLNDENFLRTEEFEDSGGLRAEGGHHQRRLSDLSALSYMDGVSSPETPGSQGQQPLPRRSSDTSDVSSHRAFHNIYHRPPTPRTPRKLLIQNNHNDISGDPRHRLSQTLHRDSLPSPHLLHAGLASSSATPRGIPTASSSPSLSSLVSQGSRMNGGGRGERSEEEEGEEEEENVPDGEEGAAEDDEGVIEFQQYLQDRGVTLDMSSVQTSDL
ncbi:hypothetical protein V1264_015925 [Littorina saxatilis]|uniref:G-protein coupled receptors family 3 profile domain-containing protein n=2 Tax=Littorina saxatilis TaxID=31220 RepID=A0AAN9BMV0_9CAEN